MKLKITVHGVAYEVDVEVLDPGEGFPAANSLPKSIRHAERTNKNNSSVAPSAQASPAKENQTNKGSGAITSPIAGTIVELKSKIGDTVTKGQVLLEIEAMKMKTSIAAPTAGQVKLIPVAVGDSVREGQVLVELE